MNDLQTQRQQIADSAFESYDFHGEVAGASGWEYTTPGRDMSRIVFLENEESGESERAVMHVVFKSCDSAQVSEVYALLMNSGAYVGEAHYA